jgi:tetratricopeptide (TPR) repeat protein
MKSAPLLPLHQLSLYNTGRMSPEQIIAAFAARRQQFERIVADLAAEKPKSRAQHHLIVGQRGMGKTMLLARIAAELRTDSKLSPQFIPLVFAEEQYAVDRLSKFWLNCLDSLADARELANDTDAVNEIDATVARLTATEMRAAKDDQPFAGEVYDAFVKAAKASGQRPVLLVDNLQLVFERIDERQQHSLRELLMRPGSPILVGTSPSPPPRSQDYGAAFYDHFKVHYLRPLDEAEMRALLLHLAEVAEREDVRQRVVQHPARLTVLRQLTGGNPRTTLTLFFLYAEDFAPSVFGDLEGLLDRVTPLYKARFEELTPQQQVVASAIANHWDPVTAATLATKTGLPPGTISSQLDRLEKTGFIERTELFGETRTGYQLAERFFNIWFLMRSASRRQRREVEFLTRFLESFYEPADRSRLARHLMDEDHFSPDRYVWSRAVAASLTDPETAEELNRHAELTALQEEAREARARLRELIDFDSLPPATLAFDDLRKKLMLLVPDDADIAPAEFAKAVLGDRAMFMNGERERLAAHAGKLSSAEIRSILEMTRKSRVLDNRRYSVEAMEWFSQRLFSGQIRAHADAQDWNRAFHQASGKKLIRLMVDTLPDDIGAAITDSSVAIIKAAIQPTATSVVSAWVGWSHDLRYKLGRYSEAEDAYRNAIALEPNVAGLWINLGNLLQDYSDRFDEAETAYRNAIALDPMISISWNNLGNLLQKHSDRFYEAETAYRQAITVDPNDAQPWNGLGNLYCDFLSRFSDAEEAFERVLQLDPSNELAQQNRLFLRRDFIGAGGGARHLMKELRTVPNQMGPDTTHLHEALFAAYDSNWGLASQSLAKAVTIRSDGFRSFNTDDWLRASAVLLHLNYGADLLAFLHERGDTARLRPWVEAVRALHLGDRRVLQNIAPEIRTTAEIFYDDIESRLKKLPEKTRRRPVKDAKQTRRKRR